MFAFAATVNVSLMSTGTVNGTQLAAGEYKLNFAGEGDNVQVSISGNGVNLTVPASVVHSSDKLRNECLKSSNGVIKEIHLGGKNLVVKFNPAVSESKGQ